MGGTEADIGVARKAKHDWPEIEKAYCTSDLTVAEISQRFGLHRRTLYRRIEQEGWPHRREAKAGGNMLNRLKRIVERRMAEIERRAAVAGADHGQARLERATGGIASLLKLLEKIVELEKAARHGTDKPRAWPQAERDRRAAELARKLARMLEQARGRAVCQEPQE